MTDREIFMNAPEAASSETLAAYIDEACADDTVLKKRVEAMFEAAEGVGDFLEESVVRRTGADGFEEPGSIIGNYKLLQQIGTGGFGVVYMAEQLRPVKRRVAFKIIKLGMDTKQVVARFEVERQALAMMDHPNIAKVFDAGATETGRPYFVMELVKGIPITKFCDEQQLDTEARLDLFLDVCNAVQHAHQKGVIHRDLKPSNVMVTMHDDKAVPKVIDFGVAKATQCELTDKTLFTQFEQFIGTPVYMSPEQAQMSGLDIDTRSDIYSMGVLLYELLTGTTPFDWKDLSRAGQDEIRRIIRETEPPKPSTRMLTVEQSDLQMHSEHTSHKSLKGDLDWIVMKALEKDRTRRYDTANALAMDVQRHLADEPVIAGAPGVVYRIQKFTRKYRKAVATTAAMATLLVTGTIVSGVLALKANRAESETAGALAKSKIAQDALGREEMLAQRKLAEEYFAAGKGDLGLVHLASIARQNPGDRVAAERLVSALVHGSYPRLIAPLRTKPRGHRLSRSTTFIEDGTKIVAADKDAAAVFTWDARSGKLLERVFDFPGRESKLTYNMNDAGISPDGRLLAAADFWGEKRISMWDLTTGEMVMHKPRHWAEIMRFSPNGTRLLAMGHGGGTVMDLAGNEIGKKFEKHAGGWVSEVAFNHDGSLVISASANAYIWDPESGEVEAGPLKHGGVIWSVDFSPSGDYVATASGDFTGQLWDIEGNRHGSPLVHGERVNRIRFSPDGRVIATASEDGTARLWDVATTLPLCGPLRHRDNVLALDFDPAGMRLATGSLDGNVQVWDVGTGMPLGAPFDCSHAAVHVKFSPDGESVLATSPRGEAGIWRTPQPRPSSIVVRHPDINDEELSEWVTCARFMGTDRILTTANDSSVRIWDATTGKRLETPKDTWQGKFYDYVAEADFNPLGDLIAVASRYQGVKLLRKSDGNWEQDSLINNGSYRHVEFSHDCSHLLAASEHAPTRVWKLSADGVEVEEVGKLGNGSPLRTAHFSPDGTKVVASLDDKTVSVWELTESGLSESLGRFEHPATIQDVQLSPDGRLLATADRRGLIRIWELAARGLAPTAEFEHSGRVNTIRFSPDGNSIVAAAGDGSGRLWDLTSGKPIGIPLRHSRDMMMAVFSPDGKRVATASSDWTARIWDAATGLPISEPLRHDGWVASVVFSEDGERLLSAGMDGTARIWEVPTVPAEVPKWMPDWVEAVTGKKLDEDGTVVPLDWDRVKKITSEVSSREGEGFYDSVAKWFYDDSREDRKISPFSTLTVGDYVQLELDENSIKSLERAVWFAPKNGIALARLASGLRFSHKGANPTANCRSGFYARHAHGFVPEHRLVRQLQQEARHMDQRKTMATLVAPDAEWMWLHPLDNIDPAETDPDFHSTFMLADFDDATWQTGTDRDGTTGGFGYGEKWFDGVDIGLPAGEPVDGAEKSLRFGAYFRHRFTTTEEHQQLELHCQRDDGIIIYLDGVEVGSDNMSSGEEAYRLPAIGPIGDPNEQTVCRIPLALPDALPPGEHILAISLHNTKGPSSDLRIGGITLVEVEAKD